MPPLQVIDANSDLIQVRSRYEEAVKDILSDDSDEPIMMNGQILP